VGDGLAAAELAVGGVEDDDLAAELAHRHLERHARPGRRLLEDHRQRLAFERPVASAALIGKAELDDVVQLAGPVLVDVEEVARRAGPRSKITWPAADQRGAADGRWRR